MRVFLIDPPGDQRGWNAGLAYLSGALDRAGIDHAVLDMVNEPVSDDEMLSHVYSYNPHIIGISIKTATYYAAVRIAETLKKSYPTLPVIAGGPHVTLYYEELLKEAKCFDAAFVGDAEESLVELACARQAEPKQMACARRAAPLQMVPGMAYREGDSIKCIPRQAPMNLDALPLPEFKHHLRFDTTWHPYPLVTSRGCPYGCIFCSVGRVSGHKWRHRSAESVVAELERAKEMGFLDFDVLDDTFTQDVDRVLEICRLLIARKLDMRWACPNGIRADRVTPELMKNMAKAGCHTVIFGVESADPELFKSINKSEKLEDVERAIGYAKSAGMRVGGYFIIGLPGDSYEKNLKGLEYARSIGLDWAHFNILAPYPGTKVWDEIAKRGRFLGDYRKAQHFSSMIRPIFELNDFSAAEISRTYKTVHARQGLYHLLLPSSLDPKKRRRAIRRLRMEYDRDRWLQDIRRDVIREIKHIAMLPVDIFLEIMGYLGDVGLAILWEARRRKIPLPAPIVGRKERSASDKLKVLMINDFIGREGGTEKYIYDLTENLGAAGHEVGWAYEKIAGTEDVGVTSFQMPGLAGPAPVGEIEAKLDRILGQFDPDIIHLHNVREPKIVGLCLKRRPTMRTVHDHYSFCPSMNKMWKTAQICTYPAGLMCIDRLMDGGCYVIQMDPGLLLKRLSDCLEGLELNRRLPHLMTTTSFMKDEIVQNGFDPTRIEVLPLFIDFPPDPPPPDESSPLRILWAGRFVFPDKGATFFLESLPLMRFPFKAIIAGDGPQAEFIQEVSEKLGLQDKVEFVGKVTPAKMVELYGWSHVVAFTSIWAEPFGYVGVEAASHARPVVAFNAGGVPDWLDDRKGGFLVHRGNHRALALKLDYLALNPQARARLGKAHREFAMQRFIKDSHIKRLIEIYNEVSSEPK